MVERKIKLSDTEEVRDFVTSAGKCDFEIDVLGLVTGMTFCLFIFVIVNLIQFINKHLSNNNSKQQYSKEKPIIERTPFTLDD